MFKLFKSSKGFTLIEMFIVIAIVSILGAVAIGTLMNNSSLFSTSDIVSTSGVKKADTTVTTNADGRTSEQENIITKLVADNKIGAIKHLYVISAYSGQVILYSTVKGKVTSSGKRLTPKTIESLGTTRDGFPLRIGKWTGSTTEVIQDDGTYGSSMSYLYWWNTAGVGHKHYVTGGQIVHISEQPLSVNSIIINMELTD